MDNRKAEMATRLPPLRGAREARGIGLRELERLTGIDRGYLSKIERGLKRPSLATLKRITVALGLKEMSRLLEPWDGGDNRAA